MFDPLNFLTLAFPTLSQILALREYICQKKNQKLLFLGSITFCIMLQKQTLTYQGVIRGGGAQALPTGSVKSMVSRGYKAPMGANPTPWTNPEHVRRP